MGALRLLLLAAIVFQLSQAYPKIYEDTKHQNIRRKSDPGHRLPYTVLPKEFDITITPNLSDSTFTGETKILLVRPENQTINRIVLHAKYLSNIQITLTPPLNPPILITTTENTEYDFLILTLSRVLPINNDFTLNFKYDGILQNNMEGFYRSYYFEGNTKKYLATTHFEPVYARKVFPCFDEPGYKSIYKISINCPSNLNCISNMKPIEPTTGNLVKFHPTPVISSYSIAFVVSEFKPVRQVNLPNQYRIWARPEAEGMGDYAFDVGQLIVDKMGEMLQMDYYNVTPNTKMDHFAIPDFSFGAMENWGLITYKETHLMYDQQYSSTKNRQKVVTVIAHEIAHQWFGNIVTCKWWSETWLNEGFASYFEYFITHEVEKDYHLSDQFVIDKLQNAMLEDAAENSPPLTNLDVNSPAEILANFGLRTYNKGAAVIRMIEHWIGKNVFYEGLRNYLQKHKFKNTVPEDLFRELENDNVSIEYKTTVDQLMGSFTRKSGFPIVHVSMNHASGFVTLTQKRFLDINVQNEDLYEIPITFTTENKSNFIDTKPAFVMKGKEYSFSSGTNGAPGWIMLNIQQTGYYRVSYADDLLDMLIVALNSDDRNKIHQSNRAQFVDDAMNLATMGHIQYSKALRMIDFLENEIDFSPWSAGIANYGYLRRKFLTFKDLSKNFDAHILRQMDNVIEDLGFVSNGDSLRKIFRMDVMNLACNLGHEECIDWSIRLFKSLKENNITVDPDFHEPVYCNGLRHGDFKDFDFLWKRFQKSNVVNEQLTILTALGCTKDQDKIMEYLMSTFNVDVIRPQDLMIVYYSALQGNIENVETVYKFLVKNMRRVKIVFGENLMTMFSSLANRMDGKLLNDFESYLKTSDELEDNEKIWGLNSIDEARNSFVWVESKSVDIMSWLESKYNSATSLGGSILLIMIGLMAFI